MKKTLVLIVIALFSVFNCVQAADIEARTGIMLSLIHIFRTNVYDFCRCSNSELVLVSDLTRKLSKSKTIPTVDRAARFVLVNKKYHTKCIIQNV